MPELSLIARSNSTFDLKTLVKMHFTQEQIANKLNIKRQQMQILLNNPEQISISRLNSILQCCGYQLQLTIIKI